MHHHHSAEDAVLWPLLLARAPKEVDAVVQLAEGHHEHMGLAIGTPLVGVASHVMAG